MITVAIGHQEPFVRRNLRAVLERTATCKVVGEASDGRAALALCQRYKPAIVLLESSIPGLSAVEIARAIQQDHLPTKILILASDRTGWNMADSVWVGIAGCIEVGEDYEGQILRAMAVVTQGGLPSKRGREYSAGNVAKENHLTCRELEVLRLIARGFRNKEIAKRLVLSQYTVEHHITSIYGKLGVTNRAEATLYAVRHGLVNDEGQSHEK